MLRTIIKNILLVMFLITPSLAYSAAMSTLSDDFDNNSFNATIWSGYGDGTTTVTESSQHMNLNEDAGGDWVQLNSVNSYDMTGSYEFFSVVAQATGAAQAAMVIYTNDDSNALYWRIDATTLMAYYKVGGASTQVGSTATWNATTYKYLKIREAAGTTYWDYSADGTTWSNFASTANKLTMTSMQIEIAAYGGSGGSFSIDNFNVAPTTASSAQTIIITD